MGIRTPVIRACPCCGLPQVVPAVPRGMRACCRRCGTGLRRGRWGRRSNRRTAAVALAALVLYLPAISMPMIRVIKFGHHSDSSILEGTATLLSSGHVFVGLVVLLCSVILPLAKLISMLVLSSGGMYLRRRHRAWTYHFVEWAGRWGMLDVLLVAILVAALKMGDFMEVSAGPAAWAFTSCVVLSLLATASFDPHSLWESETASPGMSETNDG